jgi:SNF family Na+-dependent transporter
VNNLLASLYQGLKIFTITFKIDLQDQEMDDKMLFSIMTAIIRTLVGERKLNIIFTFIKFLVEKVC